MDIPEAVIPSSFPNHVSKIKLMPEKRDLSMIWLEFLGKMNIRINMVGKSKSLKSPPPPPFFKQIGHCSAWLVDYANK